jgi:hypothetical protein
MFRPMWSSAGVKICGQGNCYPSALMLSCFYMVHPVRMCVFFLAMFFSVSCFQLFLTDLSVSPYDDRLMSKHVL